MFTVIGTHTHNRLGNRCTLGDNCIMNHFCPKGPKCVFRKQGKCKFIGSESLEDLFYVSSPDPSTCLPENMHDRGEDRMDGMSAGSPSLGIGSPQLSHFGQQLSPLASPFDGNSFTIPTYEGVGARPFSPHPFPQNYLGFTAPQGY